MEYIGIIIVLIATGIALATDLKYRKIYNKLTFPLFLSGLIFSLLNLLTPFNIEGSFFFSLGAFLKAWLGPPLIIFAYGIFVFLLKILGAGDCKFLVALTPWLGLSKMVKIILNFYRGAGPK